jgi:release factor glutamine methyltransferase
MTRASHGYPSPSVAPAAAEVPATAPLSGQELLSWRRQLLAEGGSAADFDWLLDLAGGMGWADLQALRIHPSRSIVLRQDRRELERLWRRHLSSAEPLQYLVGLCPWRDLTLQVAPGVLIPRQETELLADLALTCLELHSVSRQPLLWADLGTGSGCLALALARGLPGSRGFALDASAEALRVAATNLAAELQEQRLTLLQGHWWDALAPWWGSLQLVISNPPYIPSATVATLEPGVRDHEPHLALDGGPDGLAPIREILGGATAALAPGGWLFLEHHHDQSPAVLLLMEQAGLEQPTPHTDLEGTWRFASARRPAAATPTDG